MRPIIVVGRTNKARESDSIRQMLAMLEACGRPLLWFDSAYFRSETDIAIRLARLAPSLVTTSGEHPFSCVKRWQRRLLRLICILADNRRYDHLYTRCFGVAANDARQLRSMLAKLPEGPADFVTHSAGGVSVTMLAGHPKLGRVACFGYPFRHPERAQEPYRIRHLASVTTPLLILQGEQDPYGANPAEFGCHLPTHAQIVTLACDHDCDALPAPEFARALQVLSQFLDNPVQA
ncbi:alpha/beta family hydrolase [Novosphingobium sp. 9]|uniref:alpha/beta family hydrolase n=1 Tax=Novosphingobium sp. 9 TaxID=2025349 RepID=UPI0021B52DE3|nr:alpha/beta family hydrolase [Novosphingobium sp. 9]